QITVTPITDNRDNDRIFHLSGDTQSSSNGSTGRHTAKNTFLLGQGPHGVLSLLLAHINDLIHLIRFKDLGEIGLRPTADTGNGCAFTGLQSNDLDSRILLFEVGT